MHTIPRQNPEAVMPRHAPADNRLLAGLSATEWRRWQPHLVQVDLAAGQVLCEAGSMPSFVYFPVTAIVSLMYMTRDGSSAEFAVVGHEGVVGFSIFMGGSATTSRSVVQGAGRAWRLGADAVRSEGLGDGPLLLMLLRYTQGLIAQVAQTAVCNRYHTIDEQLCRRLLLGLDRQAGDELLMTQEGMAQLLGVRREGVTVAALKLQQAGVIRYHRGRIRVLDRHRLEARSCECYAAGHRDCDRLPPRMSERVLEPA